jgi:outer membrane murein-binding lipoprotein Lpp
MNTFRIMMTAAFVLGTAMLVSCKKETPADKAKSGISQIGEAAQQATEDAKDAADKAAEDANK